MVANAGDVQTGMDVYGSDGEKIGTISDIYPDVPVSIFGTSPVASGTTVIDEATGRATTTPDLSGGTTAGYDTVLAPTATTDPMGPRTAATTGCFKVHEGGLLGIGSKELYVPLGAVTNVTPGEKVTVNCTKDECSEHYATKPASLDQDTGSNP